MYGKTTFLASDVKHCDVYRIVRSGGEEGSADVLTWLTKDFGSRQARNRPSPLDPVLQFAEPLVKDVLTLLLSAHLKLTAT